MKRIEYIDAMRGFTMLLVVLGHCAHYLYPSGSENVYLSTLQLVRMPLFFFVSGFVFYKAGINWDITEIKEFLCKKINVQIISPLLFFLTYVYCFNYPMKAAFFDINKYGYWFTFTLFQYFVIYILTCKLSDK